MPRTNLSHPVPDPVSDPDLAPDLAPDFMDDLFEESLNEPLEDPLDEWASEIHPHGPRAFDDLAQTRWELTPDMMCPPVLPAGPASVEELTERLRMAVLHRHVSAGFGGKFQRVLDHLSDYGHLPTRKENEESYRFLQRLRTKKRDGKVIDEMEARLVEALPGWDWDPKGGTRPDEDNFEANAVALEEFVTTHGRYPVGSASLWERTLFDFWRVQTGALAGYRTVERDRRMQQLPGWPGPVAQPYQPLWQG